MFLRMQAASAWLAMPIRISVCLVSLRSCVRADLVRVWLNVLYMNTRVASELVIFC